MTHDNHEGSMEELGYRKRSGSLEDQLEFSSMIAWVIANHSRTVAEEILRLKKESDLADELALHLYRTLAVVEGFRLYFGKNDPYHGEIPAKQALTRHADARKKKEGV